MINKEQLCAIEHDEGAALVLAGPGTGKTTVITKRIIRLLELKKAKPNEILVVTFTRAAANEMKNRFLTQYRGPARNEVVFGTFHSVFYSMLKNSRRFYGTIISESEKSAVIKEIVTGLNIGIEIEYEMISGIVSDISRIKSGAGNGIPENDVILKIYSEYEKELKALNKIDFDDIIIKCRQMLKDDKIRSFWREKYKYILVDEFQDINRLQYECLAEIVGDNENIFVVGDDDQAIYRFRGSDVDIMHVFKDRYNATVINLVKNYRSTAGIITASNLLISENNKRFRKQLEPAGYDDNDGDGVTIKEYETNTGQYDDILRMMDMYHAKGIEYEDMAVLVRNNSMVSMISGYFNAKKNIVNPAAKKSGNEVSEDIAAYLYSSFSDLNEPLKDNLQFLRIVNRPDRMIGKRFLTDNLGGTEELKANYTDTKQILKNICELEFHLKMIKKMEPFAAVNYIMKGIGYEEFVRKTKSEKKLDECNRIRNKASGFKNLMEFANYLTCRNDNYNVKDGNNAKCNNGAGVNITTMHAAKGKEYKIVFLPDVNDRLVPDIRTVNDFGIEEERRLFYVAMTRAKYRLHISYPKKVMGKTMKESAFVEELRGKNVAFIGAFW